MELERKIIIMAKDIYWYKKFLRSQKLRFAIIKALSFLPDRAMLSLQYRIKFGRKCDFSNPQRWTEKLQLYKMFYRNPDLGTCVDKYEVRSYVEKKGLSGILNTLYAVYNSAGEINAEKLPQSFVLKTTDGGGGLNVVLVKDKTKTDFDAIRKEINTWMGRFKAGAVPSGREWAYSQIKSSRIVAEELLVNKENPEAGIEDFKILCFSGEPRYIIVDKDRYIDHKRNFYDTDWNRVNVTTDHEQFETPYPKPKNYDEMLRVARILSEDFPFVRVDLYNIDGKIYFGELTFYPWTGYVQFTPDSFDFELGKLMDCSSFMHNHEAI